MFKYLESKMEEGLFTEYLESLSGIYDNFLEEHIIDSKFYKIFIGNLHCGDFAVHNGEMLTHFFLLKNHYRYSQRIFKDIIEKFDIKNGFVPTCDEGFLSLSLDNHRKVELQAYFFELCDGEVRDPEFAKSGLKMATIEDLKDILEFTGDFVDRHEERIEQGELYVLREKGEFLGMGIMEKNRIMKNSVATGMFTREEYRGKGVGRSIIIHLKDIAKERGVRPIPGCWYFNHESKRTLESAGYFSKTRLLNISF